MKEIYSRRVKAFAGQMKACGVSAVVFDDSEDKRDVSIRYFTGHPSDALLVIDCEGHSVLTAWDENLAAKMAYADKVVPYTKYQRRSLVAVPQIVKELDLPSGSVIEFAPSTPYPVFLQFSESLKDMKAVCREDGMHKAATDMRAVKDEYEIECTRKAAKITCGITDEIESRLIAGTIKTEADVALLIERRLREEGCERTGFDTLAAGPGRSFAIHAFPGYTGAEWGTQGLSILDYGVVFNGYTSDATITIAKGPLSAEQKELVDLVEKAASEIRPMYENGKSLRAAHEGAQKIFAAAGRNMPHGLGHGTGLEIHEYPFVSTRAEPQETFWAGNIVTLEPGLYDPKLGGVRLENDVLILEKGNELLTNSRIIRL